jgi:dipeptidyl aminopeptidase/acylaminoacyl peptidase
MNLFVPLSFCALTLVSAAAVAGAQEKEAIPIEKYAGVYQASEKDVYSVAVFDPGDGEKRLLLTNLETGLIRVLAPGGDNVFSAGPGFLVTAPAKLQIQFHRNEQGDVVGLSGDGKAVSKEEARKLGARREEVKIRNGEIVLAGTLVRPVMSAPCPAVVFLHGSGALNRYSFGPLPDFFLSRGCAVLIYDKRGTGGSNGKLDRRQWRIWRAMDVRQSSF